ALTDDTVLPGHDYTDAAADRGLTTEDLAAEALEDAGLTEAARPRIGDSRPAPAPGGAAGEGEAPRTGSGRRRRRGGRGRGRAGAGRSGVPAEGRRTAVGDDHVRADVGAGEAIDLEDLDDETLARRR